MTEAEVESGVADPERPQGTPEANRKAWDGLPLAFGGSIACQHLCLRLRDPRDGNRHISVVVSHPVHGAWLWQPQDTNTAFFLGSLLSFLGRNLVAPYLPNVFPFPPGHLDYSPQAPFQ